MKARGIIEQTPLEYTDIKDSRGEGETASSMNESAIGNRIDTLGDVEGCGSQTAWTTSMCYAGFQGSLGTKTCQAEVRKLQEVDRAMADKKDPAAIWLPALYGQERVDGKPRAMIYVSLRITPEPWQHLQRLG